MDLVLMMFHKPHYGTNCLNEFLIVGSQVFKQKGIKGGNGLHFYIQRKELKQRKQAKQTSWLNIEDIKPRLMSLKIKAFAIYLS